MLSRVAALAFAIILLRFAPPAAALDARAGRLELDPSKTLIEFELPGSLHTTHGNFKLKHGVIDADPATGVASGLIVIDAASGDSGIGARDQRMRASVLEADKYPEITFSPDHVTGRLEADGRFRAKLQGVLALHGNRHEVVLEVLGRLAGDKLVASSHFAIPYVDWGMKDPSLLFLKVDRQVNIDIATAGVVVARYIAPNALRHGSRRLNAVWHCACRDGRCSAVVRDQYFDESTILE